MTHKEHSSTASGNLTHLAKALFLKLCITNCEHFVHNEDFRLQMCCHCERQTNIHSARVTLDRGIEKSFHLGERDDLVELASDFRLAHPKNRAVQENIFP